MKLKSLSRANLAILSMFLLVLAIVLSECVGSSSSTGTGIRTFNGVTHDKNNAGSYHATPTTTPCANTTTSCKNCHGLDLKGQLGWADNTSAVYNPSSCTKCHNVKWNGDPNWNGTTCF